MNRIRLRVILLICWLVVFYNMGRLLKPLDMSNLAYLCVLVIAIIPFIAPRLAHVPLWASLMVSIPVFLVFKVWAGSLVRNTAVLLAIIEVSSIIFTTLLTQWVSNALIEFESAIAQITVGHREKMPETAATGQGFIYREVRRARNHNRPLALLAVAVDEKSMKVTLDRMVQETQLIMMKQFKLSGVSKMLCDELEDCAVIAQNKDHFLVALPETKPEEVPILVNRLRQQVSEHIGVDLKIGAATFPRDGFTFEGLADIATKEMKTDLEPQPFIDLEQLSIKRHIS